MGVGGDREHSGSSDSLRGQASSQRSGAGEPDSSAAQTLHPDPEDDLLPWRGGPGSTQPSKGLLTGQWPEKEGSWVWLLIPSPRVRLLQVKLFTGSPETTCITGQKARNAVPALGTALCAPPALLSPPSHRLCALGSPGWASRPSITLPEGRPPPRDFGTACPPCVKDPAAGVSDVEEDWESMETTNAFVHVVTGPSCRQRQCWVCEN